MFGIEFENLCQAATAASNFKLPQQKINHMKKIFFILFALTAGSLMSFKAPAPTDELQWTNWNEGYPKAVKANKIILIDVYTDWCGWCKKMDKDTYMHPGIISQLNKDFVSIKFNPEVTDVEYVVDDMKMTGPQLLGLLTNNQRTGYPTTIFMYPQEKQVMMEVGYKDAAAFEVILNNMVSKHKKK